MKTVAVVLCGSGYLDGSEIREAVATLWALSKHPVNVVCFAPDAPQADVVNHLTGEKMKETRNMLIEAARITRGKIQPLTELTKTEYDALIMPGGFGVAKNLSSFAAEGGGGIVHFSELAHDISAMHKTGMPIGAICVAPALVALALKDAKIEVTLGEESGAAEQIRRIGHKHIAKKPNEIHVDRANKIVTTPAYMYDDAPLHEVFEGVGKLVDEVIGMIKD
jgi:enhancing lycopene biosynthesis protein 2